MLAIVPPVVLALGAVLSVSPGRTPATVTEAIARRVAEPVVARQSDDRAIPIADGSATSPRSVRTIQLVAAALIVGQSMLIFGLVFQARRRRSAEQTLRDRQEELNRSQLRYGLATTAGAVGVWDWNFETNQLFIDPVLKGILGFEDREISTRPDDWGSRVHPDDLPLSAAGIKACMDGTTDVYEVEHRMLHKDGTVRWMLSRGSVMRAADGTVTRMVGTKVDITDKMRSEAIIRDNQIVMSRSHQQIQQLAEHLITSQEGERARLARDLHDDLSQQIAALSIALRGLRTRLAAVPQAADLEHDVSSLQGRIGGLTDYVRRLSHDLHPSVLDRLGLVSALSEYCAGIQHQESLRVTFLVDGDFSSTPRETSLCLYRVVQEGLRNVVSHSNARRAEIRLQRAADDAELTIADDGRGFDVVETGKHHHGLGLVSITERVRLAGGTVSVVSELNTGTRVKVRIPLNTELVARGA